jgi:hypothetical protein
VLHPRLAGAAASAEHWLASNYMGVDVYPKHNDVDVRVIYRIAPERFSQMG